MPEMKSVQEDVGGANKKPPELGWRQGAMGFGVVLLFVALFMAAGAKGALGQLPLYMAGAGALVIVASVVAGIIAWVSAKTRVRSNTPA